MLTTRCRLLWGKSQSVLKLTREADLQTRIGLISTGHKQHLLLIDSLQQAQEGRTITCLVRCSLQLEALGVWRPKASAVGWLLVRGRVGRSRQMTRIGGSRASTRCSWTKWTILSSRHRLTSWTGLSLRRKRSISNLKEIAVFVIATQLSALLCPDLPINSWY